jgi:hypothetical protein
MEEHFETSLARSALEMALANRTIMPGLCRCTIPTVACGD